MRPFGKKQDLIPDLSLLATVDQHARTVRAQQSIKVLTNSLLTVAGSEVERVRVIWIWVCSHIGFDTDVRHSAQREDRSLQNILQTGKTVCSGYARLFSAMCRVAGLRCEEVVGYCKGLGYQTGDSFTARAPEHVWNSVEIEGHWFLIDSCWGSGEVNRETKTFHSRYNEFYFLTSPEHFLQEHFPLEQEWQLVSPPISLREFQTSVHLRPTFQGLGMTHISPRDNTIIIDGERMGEVCVEGTERRIVFSYRLWGVEDCGILSLTRGGMTLTLDPPRPGLFRLEIFAGRQEDTRRQLAIVCDFLICSRRQQPLLTLPKHPPSALGHNWLSVLRGLSETSHSRPLVWSRDGSARLTFLLSREMEIQGLLHGDTDNAIADNLTHLQSVRTSRDGDRVNLDVRLPGKGVYLLSVCRREPGRAGDALIPLCQYLLACTDPPINPRPFPELYHDWRETYSVMEPIDGLLEPRSTVRFALRLPGSHQVCVRGRVFTLLRPSASGTGRWEGVYTTGPPGERVDVGVRHSQSDDTYCFILGYIVGDI